MRICPRKFNALLAESGFNKTTLSEAMGCPHKANLAYHLRKMRDGEPINPTIIHDMIEAFGYRLGRKVALRELVMASDLPRERRARGGNGRAAA